MQVKVDLHTHVDLHENRNDLISFFKKAESEGIKKLAFLEHNCLKYIKPLQEIMAESGGIGKYYTGQLLCAFEMGVVIDANHTNEDGTNYDGNIAHILVYMPVKDAITLSEKSDLFVRDLEKDYKDDYEVITGLVKKKDRKGELVIPTIDELASMKTQTIVKDYYAWIISDEKRKGEYKRVLGLTDAQISSDSVFVRELHQTVGKLLYYVPKAIVSVSELIRKVREYSDTAKIVVAHPAYMQDFFDKKYYLETLFSMDEVIKGRRNFDGIEVYYFRNTRKENAYLEKFARENNLLATAGSDSYPLSEYMYFAVDGKKFFFKPKYGRAIGTAYDEGNVVIEEKDGKLIVDSIGDSGILKVDENLFNDIAYDCKQNTKTNKEINFTK